MTLDKKSEAAFFALVLIHFHQNNIGPDLDDTVPGNDKFCVSSEKPAQLSGTGDDQSQHGSSVAVDLQIADASQGAAGTNVDDFLLFQITQTHGTSFRRHGLLSILYVVFWNFVPGIFRLTGITGFAIL